MLNLAIDYENSLHERKLSAAVFDDTGKLVSHLCVTIPYDEHDDPKDLMAFQQLCAKEKDRYLEANLEAQPWQTFACFYGRYMQDVDLHQCVTGSNIYELLSMHKKMQVYELIDPDNFPQLFLHLPSALWMRDEFFTTPQEYVREHGMSLFHENMSPVEDQIAKKCPAIYTASTYIALEKNHAIQ